MPTMAWLDSHISTIYIPRDEKCCLNCGHFHQHYVKSGMRFIPISRGHCVYPRSKDRSAEQICKYFEERDGNGR